MRLTLSSSSGRWRSDNSEWLGMCRKKQMKPGHIHFRLAGSEPTVVFKTHSVVEQRPTLMPHIRSSDMPINTGQYRQPAGNQTQDSPVTIHYATDRESQKFQWRCSIRHSSHSFAIHSPTHPSIHLPTFPPTHPCSRLFTHSLTHWQIFTETILFASSWWSCQNLQKSTTVNRRLNAVPGARGT